MTTTNDAAELSRDHEVRIQSLVKALTTQRDAANNATANVIAEKAVLEDKLKRMGNKLIATETSLTIAEAESERAKSEIAQMRVVILNLQSQLSDKAAEEACEEESRHNVSTPDPDPQTEESKDEEKKPSLVNRIAKAVLPTRD